MIDEIKKTIEILRIGGVMLYPTDTISGPGDDATDHAAAQKVDN